MMTMVNTLTRQDKRKKREELFLKINLLENQLCSGCPFREQPITQCPKCEHSEKFTKIGKELDELCNGYREDKSKYKKYDLTGLTKERYIQLKHAGYKDTQIATQFNATKNVINQWKKQNNISQKDWMGDKS